MNYKHFSIEEREKIQELLWQKASIRAIARAVGRSPSSVGREIKRNKPPERNRYAPRLANIRALEYRKHRGRTLRLKNDRIRAYVVTHLKKRWSPEQIAGRIKIDLGDSISHEAIYQFIYAPILHGKAKQGFEDLRLYLRRRRRLRIPKGARRCQRVLVSKGRSIDERPKIVNERKRIGDWESDSIESKDRKPGLNSLVERKVGLALLTKLSDKTGKATAKVIKERLSAFRSHTITFDNGPENSLWKQIEDAIGVTCYSAHAYHSWERGSNENLNGLVRDYYPKKTDFDMITDEDIKRVEFELNTRPRKRLGWLSPLEAWSVALQS